MPRFTLYRGDEAPVSDPAEQIRAVEAKVIASRPGLALIETTDQAASQLGKELKGWKITRETLAKIPGPRRPQVPDSPK